MAPAHSSAPPHSAEAAPTSAAAHQLEVSSLRLPQLALVEKAPAVLLPGSDARLAEAVAPRDVPQELHWLLRVARQSTLAPR